MEQKQIVERLDKILSAADLCVFNPNGHALIARLKELTDEIRADLKVSDGEVR